MKIKVEVVSTRKIRLNLEQVIQSVLDALPPEHVRGISKVVVVDKIEEPLIARELRDKLPYLYHPRQPSHSAWFELALGPFFEQKGVFQRLAARMNLKTNLASAVLALAGQHYHITLKHGVKKQQFESAVRQYIEKYFVVWRDRQAGWRKRLMKPLLPYADRFGKWLAKEYQRQQRAKQKSDKATK
ncbi:MAG: hypothetical protein K1Y36_06525 [Blastocatellia bacterium]|nr:hypothetical protein [Blastocatellia bacterium]